MAALVSALLSSCGSGFLGALADDSKPGPTPLIAGDLLVVPLVVDPQFPPEVSVSIANFEFDGQLERVRVELRARGVTDSLTVNSFVSADGNSELEYDHNPGAIRGVVADLHADDVPGQLAVVIDGRVIAETDLLLVRGPRLSVINGEDVTFLNPLGSVMNVRIGPVRLDVPPPGENFLTQLIARNKLVASFALAEDIRADRPFLRSAIGIDSARVDGEDLILGLMMPPVDYPSQVAVVVRSEPSGATPYLSHFIYEPFASGPSPSSGPAEGGANVFLIGRALAPRGVNGAPDFDAVEIDIVKGSESVRLAPSDLRRGESSSSVLSFQMPPSPDGRAGPAKIRVSVRLLGDLGQTLSVVSTSEQDYFYGDSFPYFGPRGTQLRELPTAIDFAPVVRPGRPAVDAISVYPGPAAMPFAAVYNTRGNGLFSRFGPAVRAGITVDVSQRGPVDVCVADFFGSGTPAGVILNRGQSEASFARHALLEFGPGNPPVQFDESFRLAFENPGRRCIAGDLNGDQAADLLVISSPGAGVTGPVIFLSTAGRQFRRIGFVSGAPGPLDFERALIDDLDGDGFQDLVFAMGGEEPRLLFAYGDGTGAFPIVDQFDYNAKVLALPTVNYHPHPDSRVVGVHSVGPPGKRAVAMVFSGVPGSVLAPPAVIQLQPGAARRDFQVPGQDDVLRLGGTGARFIDSAHGDLGGNGIHVIAAAAADHLDGPILLYDHDASGRLVQRGAAMQYGAERVDAPLKVSIGIAVARGDHGQPADRPALFVTHEQDFASGKEVRVSTYLSDTSSPGLGVLPAAVGEVLPRPVEGVALGSFFPTLGRAAAAEDIWVANSVGLVALQNDGLGDQEVIAEVEISSLLPSTLTKVTARNEAGEPRDLPMVLSAAGELATVLPDGPRVPTYLGQPALDLRQYGPVSTRGNRVLGSSRILAADIDDDGVDDLVVLLVIPVRTGAGEGEEGEAVLILLRGRPMPAPGEFPFDPPVGQFELSTTHGNASSLAAGDFAISTENGWRELAVAVPRGSGLQNEVRFYRWDATKQGFTLSSRSTTNRVLPVGDEPTQIAAADFNGDGRTDLAVASERDRNLWIILNVSPPSESPDVDLSRFVLAPANPLPLPSGSPRQMFVRDLSGDGVPDVTLVIESDPVEKRQDVVYFLSPGSLTGSSIRAVPGERTGTLVRVGNAWRNRQAAGRAALGDLNGDGSPDLVFGWASAGPADYNLRVLFGNSL